MNAINSKPDEDWLVVVHRPGGKVRDVEKDIRKQLPPDTHPRVRTLTWGRHMATNLYADFPNVILAGTLFMADSFYTALTHLSRDYAVADGQVSPEDIKATMRGEHANLVLQALCRGRVRKSDGDRCQPMTAYVIASQHSGIPDNLKTIFPGCRVELWTPVKAPLSGRSLDAFNYVESCLEAGTDTIPYHAIADHIGWATRDLTRKIVKRPEWCSAMQDLGLSEITLDGRSKGLGMADPEQRQVRCAA